MDWTQIGLDDASIAAVAIAAIVAAFKVVGVMMQADYRKRLQGGIENFVWSCRQRGVVPTVEALAGYLIETFPDAMNKLKPKEIALQTMMTAADAKADEMSPVVIVNPNDQK